MATSLFEQYQVIDIDTHLTEPADVWTSRVSKKWGDRVPHVKRVDGTDIWFAGDTPVGMPGAYSMAGHDGTPPDFRKNYDEIPRSMYEAKARLAFMDEEKIYAQVLYPSVGGFGSANFRRLDDVELVLECVRAYNDFLLDFCAANPNRLIPVMATPFWDIAESVKEIQRCAGLGYKAVLMCNTPEAHGQPVLRDKHWDPIWAAAQDAGMNISFHVGGGDLADLMKDEANIGWKANFARVSVLAFIDNARCLTEIVFGGICHRFPKLKMVSVESGASWIPFVIEAMDWQWHNSGVVQEHPEYDLLPSEYFRRQIYASFWFEKEGIASVIAKYPDNILYETDYPHPTCQAPGPASSGTHPRLYAEKVLSGLPEEVLRKVLHDTAAGLYGVTASV